MLSQLNNLQFGEQLFQSPMRPHVSGHPSAPAWQLLSGLLKQHQSHSWIFAPSPLLRGFLPLGARRKLMESSTHRYLKSRWFVKDNPILTQQRKHRLYFVSFNITTQINLTICKGEKRNIQTAENMIETNVIGDPNLHYHPKCHRCFLGVFQNLHFKYHFFCLHI